MASQRAARDRRVSAAHKQLPAAAGADHHAPGLPMVVVPAAEETAPPSWRPYVPNPRTLVVIGPGGGTRANADVYEGLVRAGYDVVPVHAPDYDEDRSDGGYLYPPGWEFGNPELRFNRGRNLATLADDVVLPLILELVKQGRGPAAVIAGSPGGQVTVPRLWECGWRGPTVVINGGCASTSTIPGAPVRLVLVTGGRDFFQTKDPAATARLLQKTDPKVPVFLYHDPEEGHMPRRLGGVLIPLLEMACSPGPMDGYANKARWPRLGPRGAGWALL